MLSRFHLLYHGRKISFGHSLGFSHPHLPAIEFEKAIVLEDSKLSLANHPRVFFEPGPQMLVAASWNVAWMPSVIAFTSLAKKRHPKIPRFSSLKSNAILQPLKYRPSYGLALDSSRHVTGMLWSNVLQRFIYHSRSFPQGWRKGRARGQ